jgi:hypothetical protein
MYGKLHHMGIMYGKLHHMGTKVCSKNIEFNFKKLHYMGTKVW